jgi:hypothetical protein
MGEYVRVPVEEYRLLIKYKEIVSNIEEDIHEELNVKPITEKKALEKMERLHQETKAGKRKTLSKEEFLAGIGSE